jgi:hypothetical protein
MNKVKFGSVVTVVIIVTVDFDLWPFPGRRSKDSYIRYSDSITRFSGYPSVEAMSQRIF